MAKKKKKATITDVPIEEAMEELAQIVETLEDGELPLEESLAQHERATSLIRVCHQKLDAASRRIEIVTGVTDDGQVMTADFSSEATADRVAAEDSSDGSLF